MPLAAITIDVEFPDQPSTDPLGTLDRQLEVLASHHIHATCFLAGCWARAYPERVAVLKDAGHELGNHTYSHVSLERLTDAGIMEEVNQAHGVLWELGVDARPWFRAPYGSTRHPGVSLDTVLEPTGYRHIGWNAHGGDWRPEASANEIVDETLKQVHRAWPRPAILLFHSWPDRTPEVLAKVIQRLTAEQVQFVTLKALAPPPDKRETDSARGRPAASWPAASRRWTSRLRSRLPH